MFDKSAEVYDLIYHWKDYAAEAERIMAVIGEASTLLDVACGTGAHLQYFVEHYACQGLDINADLLTVAQQRLPDDIPLHQADMTDFSLPDTFDAVACLFSAIGYTVTRERLNAAVRQMAAHLYPGGKLLVEPWLPPDWLDPERISLQTGENDNMKVARMSRSEREGETWVLLMTYLVGTPGRVEQFSERHVFGLFTEADYRRAFEQVGLITHFDADFGDRGLWVGVKPEAG